jgi:hypothetical protein
MNARLRGALVSTLAAGFAGGMAGCGEDNEKRASEDFKNTKTAPESKPPTAEEVSKRYAGKGSMYPGAGKKAPSAPAAPAPKEAPKKS